MMTRARWHDLGLLVLILMLTGYVAGSDTAAYRNFQNLDERLTREYKFATKNREYIADHAIEIEALKKQRPCCCWRRPRIGAAGESAVSNEELVQIYADNQDEIDKLWLELGEETTLGEAVQAWLNKSNP